MATPSLGIDISKRKFDACLVRDAGKLRHKVFPNSPAGFSQLSAWLSKQKAGLVHACLEATGAYGEALATYLHEAGHQVSVVNPAQIKAYAQRSLSRSKTDKADATLIAQFCAERRPPEWRPQPREVRELQALARRLDSLLEKRQMEANRLEVAATAAVSESLAGHLAYLDEEIARTEESIRSHIDTHSGLRAQRGLLLSIPGIGETTAAKLLAGIMDVKLYEGARQLAAFAGLAPRLHESGSTVRRKARLSKAGAPRLRKALYFPAVVAIRHNPYVRDLSERLRARVRSGPEFRDRNAAVLRSREVGRDGWKREAGYRRRSLAETAMMRLKTIFSDKLKTREWCRQETELRVRCAAMNRMTSLGMPQSYAI